MKSLVELLKQLEDRVPTQAITNLTVSKSCIGWHIEHSLLTLDVVIDALKRSNPNDYNWTFNFTRTLILTTKKIPRGRVQSPTIVRPKEGFNEESLKDHLHHSNQKMKELESLETDSYFVHPFFGKLNLKPAILFIRIHTNHHLEIIDDILKRR